MGIFHYSNYQKYDGEWKDNQRYGKGILYYSKGHEYAGDWLNNKKEGTGNESWPNGDYYIGVYKNDLFNGQGSYYYNSTGDKYDGEWKNMRKHGKGILYYADGSNVTQYWSEGSLVPVMLVPTSLGSNIKMNELLNQGFQTVYDKSYTETTKMKDELENVKSKCNKDSIICVGGADSLTNTLLLVSCGSCWDILTITKKDQPRLVNGAWWYFTPGISFGFAPNSNILQDGNADFYDKYTDPKRLGWHLDEGVGCRLGTLTHNNSPGIPSTYKKIILLK